MTCQTEKRRPVRIVHDDPNGRWKRGETGHAVPMGNDEWLVALPQVYLADGTLRPRAYVIPGEWLE